MKHQYSSVLVAFCEALWRAQIEAESDRLSRWAGQTLLRAPDLFDEVYPRVTAFQFWAEMHLCVVPWHYVYIDERIYRLRVRINLATFAVAHWVHGVTVWLGCGRMGMWVLDRLPHRIPWYIQVRNRRPTRC